MKKSFEKSDGCSKFEDCFTHRLRTLQTWAKHINLDVIESKTALAALANASAASPR